MERTQTLHVLLSAKLTNQVVRITVKDNPFSEDVYELIDFSFITPNKTQIALFESDLMLLVAFDEIVDITLRDMTYDDLERVVRDKPKEKMRDDDTEEDLDEMLDTVKGNKLKNQVQELRTFIADNSNDDVDEIYADVCRNAFSETEITQAVSEGKMKKLKETAKKIIENRSDLAL